jgi:hypothetical protein
MPHPTETPIVTILGLNLPATVKLQVTPEQFAAIAPHNRDLRLERTAKGELSIIRESTHRLGNWRTQLHDRG